MKVYFLRHGETQYNLEMRMQGWIDIPLNEKGISQAEEAKERIRELGIRFDTVYSSPLARAKKTASVVSGLEESDLIIDDRLIEMGFGDYEGLRFERIPDDVFDLIRHAEGDEVPGNAESTSQVLRRTKSFLTDLEERDGETVLCVAHGVTIRSIYGHLNGDGTSIPWEVSVGNCALFETDLRNGEYSPLVRIL